MPIFSFPHRSLRAFGLAALMACGANACATGQSASAPQAWRDARQLVLVVTDGWDATTGTLQRFELRDGRWQAASTPSPRR